MNINLTIAQKKKLVKEFFSSGIAIALIPFTQFFNCFKYKIIFLVFIIPKIIHVLKLDFKMNSLNIIAPSLL